MKTYILSLFLWISLNSFGQQDYIITVSKDTIYGKVSLSPPPFKNEITVRQETGRQIYAQSEVKEYTLKGKKYMIVSYRPRKDGKYWYDHTRVIEDGQIRLLRKKEIDDILYYVYRNDEFTFIHSPAFTPEIWNTLIQCRQFAEKYKDYPSKNTGNWILPRHMDMWRKMIRFYNQQCSEMIAIDKKTE